MKIFSNLFNKIELDMNNIPKHVAIIMDGNGRWAKNRGLPRSAGHKAGSDNLRVIIEACVDYGIKHLTVYAFSTENWKRPKEEVDFLMNLFTQYLKQFKEDERNKNILLKIIGDKSKLSSGLQKSIEEIESMNKEDIKINLNLAVNYGGRDEINNAISDILSDVKNGRIDLENVNVNNDFVRNYLYTKETPDPELIIRSSGEQRISNFLLYQCAYSEFWFSKIMWPDFNKDHFTKALYDYQNRKRRFGGV